LDFARWGYNKGYDKASLVDVVKRIHKARRRAQVKWGHPIKIATRIPSYLQAGPKWSQKKNYGGEHPWFTEALQIWAKKGWIDQVMLNADRSHLSELSLERYLGAIAGTDVKLWGDFYTGLTLGEPFCLDLARKWVAEGLNGGFFFYTSGRPTIYDQINWKLRLIDFPEVKVGP
jgi:hypothetical protein